MRKPRVPAVMQSRGVREPHELKPGEFPHTHGEESPGFSAGISENHHKMNKPCESTAINTAQHGSGRSLQPRTQHPVKTQGFNSMFPFPFFIFTLAPLFAGLLVLLFMGFLVLLCNSSSLSLPETPWLVTGCCGHLMCPKTYGASDYVPLWVGEAVL